MVTAALVFYGPIVLVSYAVLFYWYGWDLIHPADGWLLWSVAAAAAGLLTSFLSKAFLGQYQWARDMEQEFLNVLGPITLGEAVALAALSGLAEEAFFRGVLQSWLGLVWATLLFALVHFPVTKNLNAWPVFAVIIGFVLGLFMKVSGSLIPPIVMHATVNGVNLWAIGEKARELGIPRRGFDLDPPGGGGPGAV